MRNVFLLILLTCWSTLVQAQEISSATSGWVKVNPQPIQKPVATPPQFNWQSPVADQSEHKSPTLAISLCIQSLDTSARYQVYHNGKPVGGIKRSAEGFRRVGCGHELREEIRLIPGSNELHVKAMSASGIITSASRYVSYLAPVIPARQRIALVVANAAYPKYPLKNSVNDGLAMKTQLEKLGFKVTYANNQPFRELKKTVDGFASSIIPGSEAVVFYAGHGLMVNGDNYIQPVDADPPAEEEVEYECYSMRRLLGRMQAINSIGVNLVFWDACRNNPYRSWRRSTNEANHTSINPAVGTLIVYATEPGKTALDAGDETNGLFTSELLKHIPEPGIDVNELIQRIDAGLEKRGFIQPPYIEGRLKGKFFFN